MTYEIKPIKFSGFKMQLPERAKPAMSSSTQNEMEEIGCILRASVDDIYQPMSEPEPSHLQHEKLAESQK